MKKLSGKQIRETWIKFFESKGHKYIPGVNLIPQGDDSLLWVNAGVTGLKKYFDGSEIPPSRRIVNVQKSIRTNDIENVGHTARHHTFFEMLGNFSIGDYFRKEVIAWAYEILTSEDNGFGMDPNNLYVTFNPSDKESYELWQKAGIAKDHLVALEGNYWEIGEGPCGPNTEVFYDRGDKYDPNHLGIKLLEDDIENDRYIEIWGIVFSQFNAVKGVKRENYKELPSKNIDTGAGLERIACILQGTTTNFETDLFTPMIHYVEKLSGHQYDDDPIPFKVISDHARCLSFALGDGAYFSNEGRGYVLRRIIRRAMRYGQKIGLNEPFMHKLVHIVTEEYKGFYPSLVETEEKVTKMILEEEERFIKTLNTGEEVLKGMMEGKKELSGEELFLLSDTYGFPLEIALDILEENGKTGDVKRYEELLEEQRERARSSRKDSESFHKQSKDLLAFDTPSEFDYSSYSLQAKVTGLFKDGVKVPSLDDEGDVIFDKTPFYAEMGGQVSDSGTVENDSVFARVTSVGKAPRGQHMHHIKIEKGSIKDGDMFTISVDKERRLMIERNHSATHLMHSALTNILGGHAKQKGSFVNEDYLRFDYESPHPLSGEEIKAIENEVNAKIYEGIEEKTLILPIEDAKKLGAEMEFSEKYGDTVRVVTFGDYSKEFCGGTHVHNSSEIGLFVIGSDEAISSGVRRLTAYTSKGAYNYLNSKREILSSSEKALDAVDSSFLERVNSLKEEKNNLSKENLSLKDKISSIEAKSLSDSFEDIGGISFLSLKKEGMGRDDLLKLGDSLKANKTDYFLLLVGGKDGSYPAVALAGGKTLDKCKANEALKALSPLLLGGGGGSPTMASGQFKKLDRLDEGLNILKTKLK